MASCTSGLTHIKKTMQIYVFDSNNLINIRVNTFRVRSFGHWFCYLFVLICIYSFYPVLHVAARFFLKIVKMWVRPLVHDANHFIVHGLKSLFNITWCNHKPYSRICMARLPLFWYYVVHLITYYYVPCSIVTNIATLRYFMKPPGLWRLCNGQIGKYPEKAQNNANLVIIIQSGRYPKVMQSMYHWFSDICLD